MAASVPAIPAAWPRMGNAVTRFVGRSVLRLFGWKIHGQLPPHPPCLIAGAPHTSNWDFVFAMAAILAMGVRISWLGKHTIFVWPFRSLLSRLGGIAVDRSVATGVVGQAAAKLQEDPHTVIALAPEGTRARVNNWKTGFLRIAAQAGVAIIPIGIDYRSRSFEIGPPFHPTGDQVADLAEFKRYFRRFQGKRPELAG
ncbi:1-acyl-sn-glycerol-3-phosphate acyltransferase [Microbulbifer sp. TYP-18]|uniref:1-acyl-sn-glycerol-3-phosphate acyltransferase n=1 Tax=Microbulbifer sp. TYP-18 TaxID=3230024 RepID=UPI0034C6C69B